MIIKASVAGPELRIWTNRISKRPDIRPLVLGQETGYRIYGLMSGRMPHICSDIRPEISGKPNIRFIPYWTRIHLCVLMGSGKLMQNIEPYFCLCFGQWLFIIWIFTLKISTVVLYKTSRIYTISELKVIIW